MTQRVFCALLMLAVGACATQPRPRPPANPESRSIAQLAAAIAAAAARSDLEPDSKSRAALAAQAGSDADACISQAPQAAQCLYGRAVAQGLGARAHPARAGELLNSMLDNLTRAESADPGYDEAGPARVRALVLIRAPGWPLGPGDPEAGLVAARRAVTLRPLYPPNLLAVAEALAKNGDASGARENYANARAAALALPTAPGRDQWLHDADQGLQRK